MFDCIAILAWVLLSLGIGGVIVEHCKPIRRVLDKYIDALPMMNEEE